MKVSTLLAIGLTIVCLAIVLLTVPATRSAIFYTSGLWAIGVGITALGCCALLEAIFATVEDLNSKLRGFVGIVGSLLAITFNPGLFHSGFATFSLTALGGAMVLFSVIGRRGPVPYEEGIDGGGDVIGIILVVVGLTLFLIHGFGWGSFGTTTEHVIGMAIGGTVVMAFGLYENVIMLKDFSTMAGSFCRLLSENRRWSKALDKRIADFEAEQGLG